MSEALARLAIDLTANVAGLQTDLGRANREARKFARQLSDNFAQMGAQVAKGIGTAIAGATVGLAVLVKKQIAAAEAAGEAAQKVGLTVKSYTALSYAADRAGVSSGAFDTALTQLNKKLADAAAGGQAIKLFDAVGVSIKDVSGKTKSADVVLKQLANRFATFAAGPQESALALQFFGKSGARLLPLLNEGSEGIEDLERRAALLGQVLTTETTVAADRFGDAVEDLGALSTGFGNILVAKIAPALAQLTVSLVDGATKADALNIAANKLIGTFSGLATVAVNVREDVQKLAVVFAYFGSGLKNIEAERANFARSMEEIGAAAHKARSGIAQFREDSQKPVGRLLGVEESTARLKKLGVQFAEVRDESVKLKPSISQGVDAPTVKLGETVEKTAKKVKALKDNTHELREAQDGWKSKLDDLQATLSGPLAEAHRDYERNMEGLGQAWRAGHVDVSELMRGIKLYGQQLKKNTDEIKKQLTPMEQLLDDLRFEISLIGKSNVERERAIALRGLEADATAEQREELDRLLDRRRTGEAAQAQAQVWKDAWSDVIGEIGSALEQMLAGNVESFSDLFKDMLGNIAQSFTRANIQNIVGPLQQAIQNGTPINRQQLGQGALQLGGQLVGTAIGGGGASAGIGSAIGGALGSIFGPIGSIVGSILGGLVGGLFDDDPSVRVSSRDFRGREATGRSAFGSIFVNTDDMEGNSSDIVRSIRDFDNALARLLDNDEIGQVTSALRSFNVELEGDNLDLGEIISRRLNSIITAIEPSFARFLSTFEDVEERVRALEGIRNLRDMLEDFGQTVDALSLDPMVRLRTELRNLEEAVTETANQFQSAIAAQDPAEIVQAAAAAQQALIRRYQSEVEAIRNLQAAIRGLEDQARTFRANILSRLLDAGGNAGALVSALFGDVGELREQVLNSQDTQQALVDLDAFVASVDAWLSASRAEIDAWATTARNRINAALQALDAEQQGIFAMAQERANAANAASQAAAAAQQAAQQAIVAALQDQLNIAQAWAGVLQNARRFLDTLTFTSASPLPGRQRIGALDARLAELRAQLQGATGSARAGISSEILQLLQERLQLAQGLFQRPSGEYLAIWQATQLETAALRDIAQQEADRAEALQAQILALQQQTATGVGTISDTLMFLSADERARLDAIEVERRALQDELAAVEREAADRLEQINAAARAHYQWAQTTHEALVATRHQELIAQLDAITGGLDPDAYIAQRLLETTNLLAEIRDGIAAFLALVSANGANGGAIPNPGTPGGPGYGNPGPSPGNPPPNDPVAPTIVDVTIPFELDGVAFGNAVTRIVIDKSNVIATPLRRALRAA